MALADDRAASRASGVIRERLKQERSVSKSFALRGFKGKGYQKLHGEERMQAMKRSARAERVFSGTEGSSKAVQRFMSEEGFGSTSVRPKLPWKSHGKKAVKGQPSTPEFVLNSAVARFKRTGALPDVPVSVVQAVKSEGIDARALRRMISKMLERSGVELNPGPQPKGDLTGCAMAYCPNADQWIEGERHLSHGKVIVNCPLCPFVLQFKPGSRHGKIGFHGKLLPAVVPAKEPIASCSEASTQAQMPTASAPPLLECLADTASTSTSIFEDSFLPQQVLAETAAGKRAEKVAPVEQPTVAIDIPSVPMLPVPLPVPQASTISTPTPPNPATLLGHQLSPQDHLAILSRLSGKSLEMADIKVEVMDVPYVCERRLATNRNVQELKLPFRAHQISTVVDLPFPLWFICLGVVLNVALAALSYQYPQTTAYVSSVLVGFWTYYIMRPSQLRSLSVSYVDHLVSAVMAEYDRGTNATAARSTLRQKIRRLASLPIPDADALIFINGSELVCEQLLSQENFFWEGAACFRQPV